MMELKIADDPGCEFHDEPCPYSSNAALAHARWTEFFEARLQRREEVAVRCSCPEGEPARRAAAKRAGLEL